MTQLLVDLQRSIAWRIVQSGAQALDERHSAKALTSLSIALALLERLPDDGTTIKATCQTLLGRCCLDLGEFTFALE